MNPEGGRKTFDIAVAGVCAFLSLLAMLLNSQSPMAATLRAGQRINGLLIGSDYEDNTRHSDTLMFVSYDPQSRFLDVLSIPRDTLISIPDQPHVHQINEVFAYEFRHSKHNFTISSLALKSVVQTMLSTGSVQGLSIPYFFTIDYGGFRSLIDAMGGIYVRVTEPMNYDDNWGHLHIHFEPGTYLMNGKKALEYVRFRGGSADQGRVRRQQLFVKEVLKRLQNPTLLWRLPEYAKVVLAGFHTNVSLWDMASMLLEGRHLRWTNIRLLTLPGTTVGNRYKLDPENTRIVVAMMQAPGPRLHAGRTVSRTAATLDKRTPITVEVWNASNQHNAARAVMRFLRDKGFDVVMFGDFATRQQQTLVIDRTGDLRPAQTVAEVMESANPEVVSRPDQSRQVDVSVIIGNDYPVVARKGAW